MPVSAPADGPAPAGSRSVGDVLQRIDDALENVAHVLALGPGGEPIGCAGVEAPRVVELARTIANVLSSGSQVPGGSARCVLNTSESCVFVYRLGKDLSVILVGPSDWNIALTGRRTEQLLVEFVDTYLEAMAAAGVTQFYEVGSGKVLAGLVKRIAAGTAAVSIGSPDDIAAYKAQKG